MEYAYAALLLSESGEELNEDNITRVLEAARVDVEQSQVKALVAALEDVDIEEAISAATSDDVGGDDDEFDDPETISAEPEEVEADESDEAGDDEEIGDLFD